MGGIARVDVFFERDVESLPRYDVRSHYHEGIVQLKQGAEPFYLYHTKKSAQFQEKNNIKNAAGDFCTSSLTLRTPRDRPVLNTFVNRMRNNNVAILYQDRNGYHKLLRNMRLGVTKGTGTFAGYSGASFTFTGKDKRPAGFWNWVETPYFSKLIPCPVDFDTSNNTTTQPTTVTDTNFANTDLTFLTDRVHQLENHILALAGEGKVIIGGTDGQSKLTVVNGNIEVGDGYGFVFEVGADRYKMFLKPEGILSFCKL